MSLIIRNRLDPDNLTPGITILLGLGAISTTGRTASLSIASTTVTKSPGAGAIAMAGKTPTLSIAPTTTGTQWFVRPNGGSYGLTNGTDWNNAFNGFSDIAWANIAAGDTIWVAGGTYTQTLSPTKSGSSGNLITIARARSDASACTTTAGWSSSFDANIEHTTADPAISFGSNSWLVIDGRTTASGGTWPLTGADGSTVTGGGGWHIDHTAVAVDSVGIEFTSSGSNITVEYLDIEGQGHVTFQSGAGAGGTRGIDDTGTASINHTVSHCKIHGFGNGMYLTNSDGFIFEYGWMDAIFPANGVDVHPQFFYILGADTGTIRYSLFTNSEGEGIAFSDGGPWNDWSIYGNVFANNNVSSNCKIISVQQSNILNLKVVNNTFDNNQSNWAPDAGVSATGTSITKNNIISRTGGSVSAGTVTNTLTTSTAGIFVDRANGDYHIVSTVSSGFARDAGSDAGSPFGTDRDGNTRGSDGTWDIGAYEYVP